MEYLNFINELAWPVITLIVVLLFRKTIQEFFRKMIKGKITTKGIEVEADNALGGLAEKGEKAAETLADVAKKAEYLLHQGKQYDDYSEAFRDLEKKIRDCLNKDLNNGIDEPEINLKLIAVAMNFSWNFIVSKLPKILKQYSTAKINLEILFIDPNYLRSLELAKREINWTDLSLSRINEAREFQKMCSKQYVGRLFFNAKIYQNLPHWHGWLLNDEYLFLGRTNWSFLDDIPKLLVGQNKYRYYDYENRQGIERIELFKNWQKYYIKHASKDFLNSIEN